MPLPAGENLYQIVLDVPVTKGIWLLCEQGGIGSVDCVVAPELSLVSAKSVEPLAPPAVTVMALAKLSLVGAGATTTKVGKVTVAVVTVVPPPGGGFLTPTEFVLPKPPVKLCCTVAMS